MTEDKTRVSFQKAWHLQVPDLKLLDFASDHHSFVACDKNSTLRLFNSQGQELWQRDTGHELVSVSLADTLEVLAIDSEKHAIFFGSEGATLWRKRPFPAIQGKISAAGDSFAFITADPAIIGTDRSLRVKWAYRNLMRRPADIAISSLGQTVAFPCFDDRGEGLAAVNHTGKPYDAFMGIGIISNLQLSDDGQIILAVAESGKTFCLNLTKGFGVWKSDLGHKTSGVSYASKTGESLIYSEAGQIIKLDASGTQLWEHWFSERLLKASITADGEGIFYATERGEIGLLLQSDSQQSNRLSFQEVPVKPPLTTETAAFRKIWARELPGITDKHSEMCVWSGQDGVEYSLIWDGSERLFCLNDIGEEIWQERLNGAEAVSISANPEADMAVVVSKSGITGYDLSGGEIFRFFGQFRGVHVFDDGALILLDADEKCRYYQAFDHFSHIIEIAEPAMEFIRFGALLLIKSEKAFFLADSSGAITSEKAFDDTLSFTGVIPEQFILCGTQSGLISIFDPTLDLVFSYKLESGITAIAYNKELESIFAGTTEGSIVVLQRRTGQMTRTSLTGNPVLITGHAAGAIIGTDLDQLGLINSYGQILARYTLPFKLRKLLPCNRRLCLIILSDESVGCLAAVENNTGTSSGQPHET